MEQQIKIENAFRKIVKNDKKVRNAYLLVHSEKLNVDINIAEGKTGDIAANPEQANHMASVGKLFTATIIGMLNDKGLISFEDKIINYLDEELMDGLHVYKGVDYSADISVKHLLTQTSGLNDVFFRLFNKIKVDPEFEITPREAVIWGKNNIKPVIKPGRKHFYTDTNYYLLGLIIESITKKVFHQVVHEMIFDPLGMENAFMFGFSKPKNPPPIPKCRYFY